MNLPEIVKLLVDLRYASLWDNAPPNYIARIDRQIQSIQMFGAGLGRRVSENMRRARE